LTLQRKCLDFNKFILPLKELCEKIERVGEIW
jgi:hypothetical protein